MKKHLSLNKGSTCLALDCHFSDKLYTEVDISVSDEFGDDIDDHHGYIDLTLEQVKELHNFLTEVLKQVD